ncbi:threonine/homoserine efflux transporter RhtA [Labedaea rhizosphaerae]|uniref:Threonine/homoserine efflux transporter RhtA n=1 Tax=Labedaea rhizosphaerae TaxID=598644 RepID=A0A4R6SCE4_LABRH|nr:EamA family transporter [Labedaea rhizosphaerae]TDP97263.1 threonine/homoserine efflux transporter RhtA [Labedaea rhizosphaerae]
MTTEVQTRVSPHRTRGVLLVLGAAVGFGSSGPLAKPVMSAGFTPQQVAAVRVGLAALVLLAGVAAVRPRLLRVRKDQLPLLFAYGLLGVGGVQLCYFAAIGRLPVGIAMVLEFTSPVLVALWVRFVRGTRMPGPAWFGTAMAMLGLAMIAQVWQGLRLDAIGLLAGLGAAVCSAAYFLLGERGAGAHHPLGLVTWGMVIGAVSIFVLVPPWTLPVGALGHGTELGVPVWTLLIAVALFSTAMAYLLGITALRFVPSTVASVLGLAEPVVATALAWLVLHESLSPVQLVGAAVLLSGAAVVELGARVPVA